MCAQYADNAKAYGILFDDKLRKVYATNNFNIVTEYERSGNRSGSGPKIE